VSDLGEISAELMSALDRLDSVLQRFGEVDRTRLAPIEVEVAKDPRLRPTVALIARARALVRQARSGTVAARRAGQDWLSQHGAAQAAWVEGSDIAGGRAYFAADESGMREATAALPSFPGEYTFVAHGSSDGVYIGATELTATAVAELIRSDEKWNNHPVRLFACNTGRGENPIAAELASLLGVSVTAPDDFAWLGADGRFGVAPVKSASVNGVVVEVPDCANKGRWRVFDPAP
jgi:hypothetical protein